MKKNTKETEFEKSIKIHKDKCDGKIVFITAVAKPNSRYYKVYKCEKCNTEFINI